MQKELDRLNKSIKAAQAESDLTGQFQVARFNQMVIDLNNLRERYRAQAKRVQELEHFQ